MANDHFISRFLTRRWEVPPRRLLHYFDFETSTFGAEPSAHLFAETGLHSAETGATLNRLVEQPVAQHLRLLDRDPYALLTDPESWEIYRALAALWWLQAQRIADATTPGALAFTLDHLLAHGEEVVDTIGRWAQERFALLVVRTPRRERLFFTQAASFPIPVPGAVLLALPLSPHHFMTLVPQEVHDPETRMAEILAARLMLTALSIGVGTNVHKVVLPPEAVPNGEAEEASLRTSLSIVRAASRRIVDLIGEASAIIGLPTFRVT